MPIKDTASSKPTIHANTPTPVIARETPTGTCSAISANMIKIPNNAIVIASISQFLLSRRSRNENELLDVFLRQLLLVEQVYREPLSPL